MDNIIYVYNARGEKEIIYIEIKIDVAISIFNSFNLQFFKQH